MITHPTILYALKFSPNSNAESNKTATNPRRVNGYAKLISNFVIVAIQHNPEIKVKHKAENINGSKTTLNKKTILPQSSIGIGSIFTTKVETLHLIKIWEVTEVIIVVNK